MYYFGIAALDRFKTRLKEYQKYCEHIAAIPSYRDFPPHLIEYVDYGLQSQEPPTRPQGPVLPSNLAAMIGPLPAAVTTCYKTLTSTTITTTTTVAKSTTSTGAITARPSIANATNIDTLLVATEKEEKMTAPPESLQDKIAFIFNNLSQVNLTVKCEELREIISDEYWPWVAQYLVMKRASIELNFHGLYSNFLDTLKIPEVNKIVLRETFRNIKVLLRSDKGIANFSDRSLLKNLGHWLGMLTLGRNIPILQVDIDLKSLLVEAYHKGQQELLYVVPFVAKVLESCAKSKVFKPPNPWTMAIMNVLGELHQEPDLKLTLKFEIEVLCKNLSIDVSDLKPVVYLKDQEKILNIEYQLSHPNKKVEQIIQPTINQTPSQPQEMSGNIASEEMNQIPSTTPSTTVTHTNTTPTTNLPAGPPEPRFSYMDINVSNIAGLSPHINVNGQLALFQAHPHLKQFVRPAVERAVQEWIAPVVDRAIKIAVTTCEQIVKKDFALDPEESRMRAAAHHMVRNLTAGMAMITCRDQVLVSINTNLKTAFITALMGATPQQKDFAEQAASVAAQENMELACAFIQKTAIEKAIPEIDKRLLTEFELRKQARNEGRRYCDPLVLTYQAERMPEQIRLKVGGVTPQQMAVYEEFARNIPGFLPLTERDAAMFIPKPVNVSRIKLKCSLSELSFYLNSYSFITIFDRKRMQQQHFQLLVLLKCELEHCLPLIGSQGVSSNCIGVAMNGLLEALVIARRNRDPNSAVALIQKAVEGLLGVLPQIPNDPETKIRFRDYSLCVLKAMQDPRLFGMQWTNKQVTRCLLESREEFKFNVEAVDLLIRAHLVNLPQLDMHIAQCMENGHNFLAVMFAMKLVQLYLIDERHNNPVTETDLYNTIEMLARISAHARQPPEG
ncbi:hypothetical protein J437_LFUL001140 [Ladona fulva]|uniref:CCR4-NOT transcription complex subunit 1 n=1 Tax=Ladona fulva TaxID=123851 RepID=A0A8K0JX82_LADFU|nr:hypothetical protein J437_LFUL001140 [Ladona fulva]